MRGSERSGRPTVPPAQNNLIGFWIMVLKKYASYIKIKPIHALLCVSIIFSSVLLDFITKKLIMLTMTIGESIPLIKGVINITYITNKGAAFGSFAEHRWVFMTLSVIMLIGLTVVVLIWDRPKPTFYIGTSLAIGGGIGNMIDRIAYGTVVDFIDFCAFPKIWSWIFNGADSFVCIGAGLLVIYYISDFATTSVKTHKVAVEVAAAEHAESTLGADFAETAETVDNGSAVEAVENADSEIQQTTEGEKQ